MRRKVFAVVVTYKRALVLQKCLDAILALSTYKIDRLHVIVNAEERDTLDVMEKVYQKYFPKISFKIYDNIGPAGGFYYGLKEFLSSDCDYVWLMDDDIIPEPKCLENLIACSKIHPYVFSKVIKKSGEQVTAFGWWGVLISKPTVEKVGLPIKDFFYWTEDTEYLQNRMIRKFGIIPYRCENAVVKHLHKRNALRPSWYYYYTVRNTLYYRMNIFPLNTKGFVILTRMFFGLLYRILFIESLKLQKLRVFFLGITHAFTGRLGKLEKLHLGIKM